MMAWNTKSEGEHLFKFIKSNCYQVALLLRQYPRSPLDKTASIDTQSLELNHGDWGLVAVFTYCLLTENTKASADNLTRLA